MGKDFTRVPGVTEIKPNWWLVDADGKTLGRMATRIATILMGKHRPSYSPERNCGDFVVVINAEKIVLTGKKTTQKTYDLMARGGKHKGSTWPHGLHIVPFEKMQRRFPDRIVRLAVKRMLRNTKRNRVAFTKLKVYAGANHPHAAQAPRALAF
ncbi:MAG: 50S ribosomal protein L13 [Candidatus Brocadiae bacterium]|nr:50S ribosomal protein L13 [Candidatus Brocadiia bacterium]